MADEAYYRAEVRERVWLTPHMVRLRLGAPPVRKPGASDVAAGGLPDLTRFVSTGVGDERLVLVLPGPGEDEPPLPVPTETGWDYPDPASRPVMRSYTVRSFDPDAGELAVDVVAHEGGVASDWARSARVGDRLLVTEARGWYDPPVDAEWQLLLGDLTALPAIGRLAESIRSGLHTMAVVEVVGPADRQPLPAGVRTRWLCGSGNGLGPSRLLQALHEVDWPAGPGYVWFAGEAADSRAVRRHLRHDLGWPAARYDVLGYWRAGQAEWTRRYEQLAPGLEQVYTDAVRRGLSSTEALEVYDDALERVGL